ncbi:DMT family transporter [Roseibium sp.]|uniref:DMT family transporter n=1 Tax=Roseibium sp. TaxID=1936156 RepID=UPI003A96F650
MSSSSSSPILGLGTAFLGFAFYATHDALTKHLGGSYTVFQIIFFAMLFAFVPMAILMLADKQVGNFRPTHPWLVSLRSALTIVALSGGFYAFTVLPLAEVYSLLFAAPLLITVFSIPILGEVVRVQRWAAVIVGLVGVLIVLRPGTTELTFGHAAALMSACASALASVLVRKIGPDERSAVLILYPMLLSMIIMGALLPGIYVPVELTHLAMMAAIGFLSVAAQYSVISGYRSAPAAVIAPMQYSQILWATLFGYFFFDEIPDIYVGLGSGVIIASGLFLVWRESRASVSVRNPVSRTPTARFALAPSLRIKRSDK